MTYLFKTNEYLIAFCQSGWLFQKSKSPQILLFSLSLSLLFIRYWLIFCFLFVFFFCFFFCFFFFCFLHILIFVASLCVRVCVCVNTARFFGFLIQLHTISTSHHHYQPPPGPSYFPSLRGGRIGYHETSAEKSIHRQTGERKVRPNKNKTLAQKWKWNSLPLPKPSRNRETNYFPNSSSLSWFFFYPLFFFIFPIFIFLDVSVVLDSSKPVFH